MRAGIALVFWRAGKSKLPIGNESTIGLFRDIYQVPLLPPELAAHLATIIEIAGAALLGLGVLTRPTAAVLLAQTLVIQLFVFPENYPDIGLSLAAPDEGWRRRPDMNPDFTRLFRASIVARARFIEDLVAEQAGRGVRQYAILGAGLASPSVGRRSPPA